MRNNAQKTKYAAMSIYVVILACIILSLFLPVFDGGIMLFREIPASFGAVSGGSFKSSGFFVQFGLASYYGVNIAALAVAIYFIISILAILAFIPVFLLNKSSRIAVIITFAFEILVMLSLLLFLYDRLTFVAVNGYGAAVESGQMGWLLIIMLGVIWLLYTLQSVCYMRGAGIAKSLLFALSVCGVLCLFSSKTALDVGWTTAIADWIQASYFFIDDFSAIALLSGSAKAIETNAVYGAANFTSVLVLINLVIDTIAIAVKSNKWSKTFNLARYGVELISAIITAIIGAVNAITLGIYLYILMAVALTQIVVSTIRMFTRATFEEAIEYGFDYGNNDEEPKFETPAAEAQTASGITEGFYEAPDATTATPPPVYTPANAYQDDSFLTSLSPSERAEFYAIFIDKRRGNFYFLPDYVIGGENVEFFQTLFIYLGKIMGYISDGLMNKIYQRLNMLT